MGVDAVESDVRMRNKSGDSIECLMLVGTGLDQLEQNAFLLGCRGHWTEIQR